MKLKLVASAAAVMMTAVIGAQTASAITIDYRHEFTDASKQNKDRVMISDRFSNGLGYSVETKAKSGGEKEDTPYSDMVSNGAEFSVTWQFKPWDGWTIQPGVNAEFGNNNAIYKPLFRVQYTFDNGLYIAARYRYEYTRDARSNTSGDTGRDQHMHRYEGWVGYRTGPWRGEFNFIWRDSDRVRHDNKHQDYELDFKLSYDIDQSWTPYIQVGNVKSANSGTTTHHRETRFRAGIQYKY